MANVHMRFEEDAQGNLVDVEYFHHWCAPSDVLGYPAPDSVDYPVYCGNCELRVIEVPLTDHGIAEELANDPPPADCTEDCKWCDRHPYIGHPIVEYARQDDSLYRDGN